jgi:ABC-type dipeptide/oligopeptide/nickel transport system ATPase component
VVQGVNVSGGQKQRIAIARAVYANADVYLFDDPLSALDAKVGRKVFRQCIQQELGQKTRVMVTNQLQYVPEADKVVVLKGGMIAESGTYAELMAQKGSVLAEMMADVQIDKKEEGPRLHALPHPLHLLPRACLHACCVAQSHHSGHLLPYPASSSSPTPLRAAACTAKKHTPSHMQPRGCSWDAASAPSSIHTRLRRRAHA